MKRTTPSKKDKYYGQEVRVTRNTARHGVPVNTISMVCVPPPGEVNNFLYCWIKWNGKKYRMLWADLVHRI